MAVNKKKSLRLKNRTKYFIEDKDRTYVRFGSPLSYQARQQKIEGYETRLYYGFRDSKYKQVFFYTLTYNDKAMPNMYGMNCFDYEDLRYLLVGGFQKMLLRKYGTKFDHFIGAELGDGKGSRGMHNNPHYHILFFLEDAKSERYPYKEIAPEEFRHLVRKYWQGFDQDTDGFKDFNEARYGIAKEGENCGLVSDFRACMYCAKYVCKDAQLKQHEETIERKVKFALTKRLKYSREVCEKFLHEVIYDMFNTPDNAFRTSWIYTDEELIPILLPDVYRTYLQIYHSVPREVVQSTLVDDVKTIIERYSLQEKFNEFFDEYISEEVRGKVNEWRNRYSNKCRISQGLGDYALQFIEDKMNPAIKVPGKKGFKNRPLGMYYYRKLYTTVIRPTRIKHNGEVVQYPPMRVLNDLGIAYKLKQYPNKVEKMMDDASNNLRLILNNPDLFEKMKESDINVSVFWSHDHFLRNLEKVSEDMNIKELFKRYAEYKLVYEDRFFKLPDAGCDSDSGFPPIDVIGDYKRFLVPSVFSVSRSDIRLDAFLESGDTGYLPYSQHPYFLRFIGLFNVLDMCADYWFIQNDDEAQRKAEEVAATKRFHNSIALQQFYKQFK